MRTLNRPMFRYGGPIKEGVMHGIRENKKHGGSMGPNEGPRRAALVGDPNFPQTNGRAHHVAPLVYGGMLLARAAPYAMRAGRALQGMFGSRKLVKDVGTKIAAGKNTAPFTPVKDVFNPNKFSSYFLNSPEGRFVTGQGGKLSGFAKSALKGSMKSPLLAGGAIYSSDILPGGEPLLNLDILGNRNILGQRYDPETNERIKGTGISGLFGEKEIEKLTTDSVTKVLTDSEKKAIADSKAATAAAAKIARENFVKAEKEKRYENYRKIMDIEGMQKDAAYDSLIAASQAVNASGDFKGDIKDGSLINKIIASTSKAFDKPKDTKKAINSLILKGEIEKDLATAKPGTQYKAASDYASMQGVSIDQAYKDLGFSKVSNIATNLTAVNKSLGQTSTSSETLDQAIRLSNENVIPKILADDTKMLELEKDPDFKDSITLFQETVKANKLGEGVYIIGTEAFQIDAEGNQTQIY